MASFPGLFKDVGPAEEENGELDGSLQQMLKAIADERSRLNLRQEVSGLGESVSVACGRGPGRGVRRGRGWGGGGHISLRSTHHLMFADYQPAV